LAGRARTATQHKSPVPGYFETQKTLGLALFVSTARRGFVEKPTSLADICLSRSRVPSLIVPSGTPIGHTVDAMVGKTQARVTLIVRRTKVYLSLESGRA
jgi:hypothetical protein